MGKRRGVARASRGNDKVFEENTSGDWSRCAAGRRGRTER